MLNQLCVILGPVALNLRSGDNDQQVKSNRSSKKAGVMNEYLRSALFIAICVVDVAAIGLGIGLYVTGA
jgi:hypothetical protein